MANCCIGSTYRVELMNDSRLGDHFQKKHTWVPGSFPIGTGSKKLVLWFQIYIVWVVYRRGSHGAVHSHGANSPTSGWFLWTGKSQLFQWMMTGGTPIYMGNHQIIPPFDLGNHQIMNLFFNGKRWWPLNQSPAIPNNHQSDPKNSACRSGELKNHDVSQNLSIQTVAKNEKKTPKIINHNQKSSNIIKHHQKSSTIIKNHQKSSKITGQNRSSSQGP